MQNINKTSKLLMRLFYGAYFIVLTWLCVNVWLNANNNLLFFCGSVFYISASVLFVLFLRKFIDNLNIKKFNTVLNLAVVLYGVLVFYMGYSMRVYPDYDFGAVFEAVIELVNNGVVENRADYFLFYKNNVGLLLIVSFVYEIAALFGYVAVDLSSVLPGLVLNALCITITVFCVLKIARILFKKNIAVLLSFCLCALFLPYYLWSPSFYSHTVSMPFVVLSILFYLHSREKTGARQFVLLSIAVFSAVLGYLVKGSVMVVLVAIFICTVLDFNKNAKEKIIAVLIIIAICAAVLLLFDYWLFNTDIIDYSTYDETGLPFSFWFSMGSHGEGKWDGADREFALNFATLEERNAALWQRTIDYYSVYTPQTYYEFLSHKIISTWGDGKFGAQISHNNPIEYNWSRTLVFEGFLPFSIATVHSQFMLQMIYWLNLISLGFCVFKAKSVKKLLLHLCVFGLMLFLVFWESWASYVLNFTPVLLLLAIDGVMNIELLASRFKKDKNKIGN